MNPFLARLVIIGALCTAVLDPTPAFAQATDPTRTATAQILYEQASADMEKKNYAAACKKLEEVVRLLPDVLGARMKLGECYEIQGKTASAWSQYIVVEAKAPQQQQAERAQQAAERASALKPKLAMLTIEVPAEVAKTPGLSISRDGMAVGEGQWGTPLPVDAGAHEVTASAPGRKPWTKQVEVLGDGASLTAKVQAPTVETEPSTNPLAALFGPRQRPIGVGATAVGAAGLLLGGVMGGLSMWKRDASNAGPCDPNGICEPDGTGLRNDALLFGNISTVGFIAGGVLTGAGIVLLVLAPPSSRGSIEQAVEVRVLPGGVAFAGRF
jgi:hypothetical protein